MRNIIDNKVNVFNQMYCSNLASGLCGRYSYGTYLSYIVFEARHHLSAERRLEIHMKTIILCLNYAHFIHSVKTRS